MQEASRSSDTRRPSSRIAASLERMSPPLLPSVVEEASSHCSLGDVAQEAELPGVVAGVAHQAGDLHLMHGEDHRRRGAGRAEDRADVGDVGGARALAAEFGRDQHAEQLVLADRRERLVRESALRGRLRRRMRAAILATASARAMKSREPGVSPALERELRRG